MKGAEDTPGLSVAPGAPLAFQVMTEIGILHQLANAEFQAVLPKGVSPAQFGVLNHFVRLNKDTESPARLAKIFQVTRPTMSSTLGRMELSGLINIVPDPADGRAKLVSLTDAGRSMRQECIARVSEPLKQMAEVISPKALAAILPPLTDMREKLDAIRS